MKLFLITAGIIFASFAGAGVAFAQSLGSQPDPVQFSVAPDVPAPGQTVLIEAQGIGTFLGDANITWEVNGKVAQSGVGSRSFSFTTGALGSQTRVHVIINSPSKGTITRDFVFLPSLVDMIWEANTSAPIWYRSKPLYSPGSTITVTAFPQVVLNGATVGSNNLSFKWSQDGTPLPDQSGKGMSSVTIQGSQLHASETVAVEVSIGTTLVAKGEITIPSSKPQIVLYDRDPLRGVIYDESLPDPLSLAAKEMTIQAVPYFFSNESLRGGTLPYAWTLNDTETTGPDSAQGILTLRQAGSGAGKATLGVSLQDTDPNKYLQSADAALEIVFGQSSSNSSLFGL